MLRRIVRHAEFKSFVNAKASCRLPHFFVPVLPEAGDDFAYGITVSAKTGNAVKRNLLKRRIKAWFWNRRANLPQGVKINLIARAGACELTWNKLCEELEQLITQLQEKE
ncbi:MAG TPA: ribonuclease P protein component [Candidatus Cloacimonadota bacterium]|nr:ribonuclease P protein component [Candidatus Cloacimonadota bacterium]HQL14950.1 ribonuclease P protein component [Candidatus Cloacimonadota bacterium]